MSSVSTYQHIPICAIHTKNNAHDYILQYIPCWWSRRRRETHLAPSALVDTLPAWAISAGHGLLLLCLLHAFERWSTQILVEKDDGAWVENFQKTEVEQGIETLL